MSATTLAAVLGVALAALIAVSVVAGAIRDVGIARATTRDPIRDRKADERAAHRDAHELAPPDFPPSGALYDPPRVDRLGPPSPHATGGTKD